MNPAPPLASLEKKIEVEIEVTLHDSAERESLLGGFLGRPPYVQKPTLGRPCQRRGGVNNLARHGLALGIWAWVMTSFSGCGSGGKIAAVVNGHVIMEQELDQRMARLNPSYRSALGNDRRRLLEDMILETLLVQEARRRGLDNDPQVRQLFKEARRQILLGRLLEKAKDQESVKVTDQEVTQFYKDNRGSFTEPETFRASHILVDSEEAAKKALERVKSGELFAKVAQELSTDPTKTKGGDIGFFAKGQLIPEFEEASFKLKPGEVSPIVKSSLGYHIILLTERRAARDRPLEEVQDQIRKQLASTRQQRQVESFVQELRAKAQIQILEPAPPAPAPSSSRLQSSSQSPKP